MPSRVRTHPNPNPNPSPNPNPNPNPNQVEEQCNDPKLMQCGLEKCVAFDGSAACLTLTLTLTLTRCVASDGSVEWVAAHSKARPTSRPG